MRHFFFTMAAVLVLFSCKKTEMSSAPVESAPDVYSTATYQITVTGKWNGADFGVPAGVHFTRIAGAVHSKEISLWKEGTLASKSIEAIAENGNAAPLWRDIDTLIANGKALTKIAANTPPPTGTSVFEVNADTRFPLLSFASMLAPTPDWFFGASSLPLYRNRSWVSDTTIQLYSFDGGTEDGDVFGYNNPETSPQQPIQLLSSANASVLFKGSVLPIAEVRLRKQ